MTEPMTTTTSERHRCYCLPGPPQCDDDLACDRFPVGLRSLLLEPPRRAVEHVPSRSGFVGGCRCRGCTDANTAYVAEWRARGSAACHRPTTLEDMGQLAMEVWA